MHRRNLLLITLISLCVLFQSSFLFGQVQTDTLVQNESRVKIDLGLVLPPVMIAYGFVGLGDNGVQAFNEEIKKDLQENIDEPFHLDEFLQFAPSATLLGLSLSGVKGKNTTKDQSLLLLSAYAIMGVTVYSLKQSIEVRRPDHHSKNSFPSGHTATAFMGAELLRQEYRHVSNWIWISGYAVAAGTGFFRMYNNRHWLSDVLAGAGIGILSVRAAYWIQPLLKRKKRKETRPHGTFLPAYDGESLTLNYSLKF